MNEKDIAGFFEPVIGELVKLEKRVDKMATTPDVAAAELRILARANLPSVTTIIHPGVGEAFRSQQS